MVRRFPDRTASTPAVAPLVRLSRAATGSRAPLDRRAVGLAARQGYDSGPTPADMVSAPSARSEVSLVA